MFEGKLRELKELIELRRLKRICKEGKDFNRVFAIRWKDIEGVSICCFWRSVYGVDDFNFYEIGEFVEKEIYGDVVKMVVGGGFSALYWGI